MKYFKKLYFPFFMALFMSGIMSLQMLFFREGYSELLWTHWLHNWPRSFIIAFPAAVIVSPQIRKLVSWLEKLH